MNPTATKILRLLLNGPMHADELARAAGIKNVQFSNIFRILASDGYAERTPDRAVILSKTRKARLLQAVSHTADVETVLGGSNETVLASIGKSSTINMLMQDTGLARSAVSRSVAAMCAAKILRKDGDLITIADAQKSLGEFAALLREERRRAKSLGNDETILYERGPLLIRRVRAGSPARGHPTGFTAFSKYGVTYRLVHDYYCEGTDAIDVIDVLLHAVLASAQSGSMQEMTMCVVFYLRHRSRMDLTEARRRAASLNVLSWLLDIEAYVRRASTKHESMFLPWHEFIQKADMYDIPPSAYKLPESGKLFFKSLGTALDRPITAYLLGGENMRIRGLKNITKDTHLAVRTSVDFDALAAALERMGYDQAPAHTAEDSRIDLGAIFLNKRGNRVDLFTRVIVRDLTLSPSMMRQAEMARYGLLHAGLLRNEHVLILKAAAGREGDIHDMAVLANTPSPGFARFDWSAVWQEIVGQRRTSPSKTSMILTVFESLSYLDEMMQIKNPILGRLRRMVTDDMILSMLRGGAMAMSSLIDALRGGDITDALVRNRVSSMSRAGLVRKIRKGRTVLLVITGER